MSTITRELAKLFRKITNSEIDAEGNAHVVLFPADSLLINNARIALASLEAEAVAYMHHSGQVVTREECCDDKIFAICCKVETPLYAAPQLPQPAVLSVPAAMEMDDDFDSAFEHGKAVGWNACRAAMLQSFGNSEQLNSPVIQDGSEDTKRLDWLDAQNKRLNEYYWTTYGWKFDANFQRNAMMLNDSNYPVMTVRQAIDEAIAAAPQQEVTAKPKK